jgi:hypothetical protein
MMFLVSFPKIPTKMFFCTKYEVLFFLFSFLVRVILKGVKKRKCLACSSVNMCNDYLSRPECCDTNVYVILTNENVTQSGLV